MRSLITSSRFLAGVIVAAVLHSAYGAEPALFEPIGRFKPASQVEAVTVTPDGKLLIYTNPGEQKIGFIDITDPANPVEAPAAVPVNGTPTSVAVLKGRWAIAVVAKPYDAVANQHSGEAVVIDLKARSGPTIVRTIDLGGQPDSIAISPDSRYAAITIENERIAEMGVTPPGFLAILDLAGSPARWELRTVNLTGLAEIFPEDPEPEYVDINKANRAAITLQENNHVVIVDLRAGTVVSDFSAGRVSQAADLTNDGTVSFTQLHTGLREPDGIAWTPGGNVVIANEGDLTSQAGGRNFTIFSQSGEVVYDPGSSLEVLAHEAGLYRDNRSAARGAEINTVRVARFGKDTYLFASSEKMDFVAVYRLGEHECQPEFLQFLQTGDEPEGMVAIRSKGLLVTGNEDGDTLDIFVRTSGNQKR